jgi:hypothetical protein
VNCLSHYEASVPKSDLGISDGYVPVADRIRRFYERFPGGRIVTKLVRRTDSEVVVRAAVFRNTLETRPAATGLAAEREGDGDINTVACLENTETSAIGRALANLGLAPFVNGPTSDTNPPRRRSLRARRPATSNVPLVEDPDLQRRADRVAEVVRLLRRAERLGLSANKTRILGDCLTRRETDVRTVNRLARRLREWLDRRFDRALDFVPTRTL